MVSSVEGNGILVGWSRMLFVCGVFGSVYRSTGEGCIYFGGAALFDCWLRVRGAESAGVRVCSGDVGGVQCRPGVVRVRVVMLETLDDRRSTNIDHAGDCTLGTMARATHPDIETVKLPDVLHALADPIRLGLVRLLSDGEERAWGQLDAPIAPSTLSHHLKVLRSAGITRTRMEGNRCFVRLRTEDLNEQFPDLMETVLALASGPDSGLRRVGLKDERDEA